MAAKKPQEREGQRSVSTRTEHIETITKKRGRPKKAVNEEAKAVTRPKSSRKSTANTKCTPFDAQQPVSGSAASKRFSKSWEDIVQEANTQQLHDEIQMSDAAISTIREDVSRRRIRGSITLSSSSIPAGKPFAASNISIQPPILRQQAALMSTKTSSSPSSPTSSNAVRSATRTGAQPPPPPRTSRVTSSSGQTITGELPPGYNKKARQWTMLIVSVPFVIVSSWWLYERLVLGKEQKVVQPGENPIQVIFKTKQQAEIDEMQRIANAEFEKAVTASRKKDESEFVIAEIDKPAIPIPISASATTDDARREGGWSWR